jgi:hypothetical protein
MHELARGLGAGIVAAGLAAVGNIDPGTLVIIAGGVIWAIATWRRDRRQVILDNNKDLTSRVQVVEQERDRLVKHAADLEAELKRRPELGALEKRIDGLVESLTEHDRAVAVAAEELKAAVDRNTAAIQLWATEAAKRI